MFLASTRIVGSMWTPSAPSPDLLCHPPRLHYSPSERGEAPVLILHSEGSFYMKCSRAYGSAVLKLGDGERDQPDPTPFPSLQCRSVIHHQRQGHRAPHRQLQVSTSAARAKRQQGTWRRSTGSSPPKSSSTLGASSEHEGCRATEP